MNPNRLTMAEAVLVRGCLNVLQGRLSFLVRVSHGHLGCWPFRTKSSRHKRCFVFPAGVMGLGEDDR